MEMVDILNERKAARERVLKKKSLEDLDKRLTFVEYYRTFSKDFVEKLFGDCEKPTVKEH